MGWESARRAPHTGIRAGAHTIKPTPPPPRPEPEPVEYTQDEIQLTRSYYKALLELAAEDPRFKANKQTFAKWDYERQLRWIYAIEQQALDGMETIGIHVVARVVMNRLEQ
jgi:hypothetical protein